MFPEPVPLWKHLLTMAEETANAGQLRVVNYLACLEGQRTGNRQAALAAPLHYQVSVG